jgi:transposase
MSRSLQSWQISDSFWQIAEPLIPKTQRDPNKQYKRKPGAGRKPMESRRVLEAIFFVLRTGIQWKALPKEMGSGSAVHKHFQNWQEAGFFLELFRAGLLKYEECRGIDWQWQSIDGCKVESPLGVDAVGPNPVDRGKKWVGPSYPLRRTRRSSLCGDSGCQPQRRDAVSGGA